LTMKPEVWRAVMRAIESAIPEYDVVNEKVSLGFALGARMYAVEQLNLNGQPTILDAGIGPGTMSEVLLTKAPDLSMVGLDASTTLLQAARDRLRTRLKKKMHLVRGAFEALPFRENSFQNIVSAYAFRDARNRTAAIREFHRISTSEGTFAIIDLGKPDSRLKRLVITIYVRYVMRLIAALTKSSAISGNPWQMIFPTYVGLSNNGELVRAFKVEFPRVEITEFGLGGVVIIFARKANTSVKA